MSYDIRYFKDGHKPNPEQVARYLEGAPLGRSVAIVHALEAMETNGPSGDPKTLLGEAISIYLLRFGKCRIAYSVYGKEIFLLYGFDARNRRDEDVGMHEATVRARKLYGVK